MFVVNSRLGLSCATHSRSRMFLSFTYSGLSFSRSYGYILPSSLTRVFPRTLEFSSCLPVSVLVRAASSSLEAFLDNRVPVPSPVFLQAPYHFSAFRIPDLPGIQPTCLDMLFQSHANFPSCVTPSLKQTTSVQEFQPVVHLLLRLRLGLGPDLPWVDDRCPGTR